MYKCRFIHITRIERTRVNALRSPLFVQYRHNYMEIDKIYLESHDPEDEKSILGPIISLRPSRSLSNSMEIILTKNTIRIRGA